MAVWPRGLSECAVSGALCAWMTVVLVLSGCDEGGSRPPSSPTPLTPPAARRPPRRLIRCPAASLKARRKVCDRLPMCRS